MLTMQANSPRSSSTVRVALRLPFSAEQVADYLFMPEVVELWLGKRAELRPELSSKVLFPKGTIHNQVEGSQEAPSGRVITLDWPAHAAPGAPHPIASPFALIVKLNDGTEEGQVSFRISPCERCRPRCSPEKIDPPRVSPGTSDYCQIRIAQSGLESEAERLFALKSWQAVINRIDRLLQPAQRAKRRERQAIIVVHGIGEQRPGQMLREFVNSIFPEEAGEVHFMKPDYLSPLFEMRVATVPGKPEKSRPTTDVYELYWAHLIRDTSLAQVYRWVLRLLMAKNEVIPPSLKTLVWLIWVGIFVAVVLSVLTFIYKNNLLDWLKGFGFGALVLASIPALAKLVYWVIGKEFIIGYAGDAARYLEPHADNIARRQAIREAGAKLLDDLHAKRRYERIIVYGHSLGSVIAYDIISHAWMLQSRKRDDDVPRTSSRALRRLEDRLNPREASRAPPADDDIQSMQHAAWQEYRRNGFQWRVSDLVTAGSPLTHAKWLLNLDEKNDFDHLKQERFFPTCPPQPSEMRAPGRRNEPRYRQVFTFTHAYDDPKRPKSQCSVQVPHHAGLFALTRWTNLYFPSDGLLKGDPVAGPLKKPFGDWVKDVELTAAQGFAHNRYTDQGEPASVEQVRAALNLSLHRPLADYQPRGE
jgi:hypothetical protein